MRLVAFDGTPVPGGFGGKTPIFDGGDHWFTPDGRKIKPGELDTYKRYITRVTPREDEGDVLLYRSPYFYLLPIDSRWWVDPSVCGNFVFFMTSRLEAQKLLEENSLLHLQAATSAYEAGAKVKAAILATHGMMTATYGSPTFDALERFQAEVRENNLTNSVYMQVLQDCRDAG